VIGKAKRKELSLRLWPAHSERIAYREGKNIGRRFTLMDADKSLFSLPR
jgi:hypothetical protein